MDPKPREARLESFIHPIVGQWQSSELSDSLSSFEGFSELLGLGNIQKYLSARNVHRIPDWSSHPLDDEGKSIQSQMQDALEVSSYSIIVAVNWTYKGPATSFTVYEDDFERKRREDGSWLAAL